MNNEVKKETNLEHYKEKLKDIFAKGYNSPRTMASEIVKTIDGSFKCRTETQNKYTDKILDWMAQPYNEPILDDVEKAYLRAVIKPFRKNVNYISKIDVNYPTFKQFISIKVNHTQCVNLPNFSKKSGMYKGMEVNKHYTLEELGL